MVIPIQDLVGKIPHFPYRYVQLLPQDHFLNQVQTLEHFDLVLQEFARTRDIERHQHVIIHGAGTRLLVVLDHNGSHRLVDRLRIDEIKPGAQQRDCYESHEPGPKTGHPGKPTFEVNFVRIRGDKRRMGEWISHVPEKMESASN